MQQNQFFLDLIEVDYNKHINELIKKINEKPVIILWRFYIKNFNLLYHKLTDYFFNNCFCIISNNVF